MRRSADSTSPAELQGRITLHPRGFGFLSTSPDAVGQVKSAFIPPPLLNNFLAGDVARAELSSDNNGRMTVTKLELLQRHRDRLFGEVVKRRNRYFLRVDREVSNSDWPLHSGDIQIHAGDWIIAKIDGNALVGERRVDSHADLALEQVIARHGLRSAFDSEVLREADLARSKPHVPGARRDLRHLPTVTIDAASTKDIDDAISIMPADSDGAIRLLVSIADVSEFVQEGTALDAEAFQRATSVYLAGRVLTMLPDILSDKHLSLLPGEDRSCLTVEIRLDTEGRVLSTDVYESLICSFARLTYDDVAAYLDHQQISPELDPVKSSLPWFRTAAARIGLARARRGGIEVVRDEAHIVLNATTGEPSSLEQIRLTSAHVMIERFMVAANEAIALWLSERGVPTVYRIHDTPAPERVADFEAAAHHFGYEPAFGKHLTPLALSAFDLQMKGAANEPALRSVLLRSLGPARYAVSPAMHFGLAAPLYLHFTSPIRRYADLIVHRVIKSYLRGKRQFDQDAQHLDPSALHINHRSWVASRGENDRRRILVARLMASQIGKCFSGRIVRIRPFGLIVQLDTSLVEGSIPLDGLPDGPYQLDSRETALQGPKRSYAIGMAVAVRLASTDTMLGRIEFALSES